MTTLSDVAFLLTPRQRAILAYRTLDLAPRRLIETILDLTADEYDREWSAIKTATVDAIVSKRAL